MPLKGSTVVQHKEKKHFAGSANPLPTLTKEKKPVIITGYRKSPSPKKRDKEIVMRTRRVAGLA
jgi:hypothetical protein